MNASGVMDLKTTRVRYGIVAMLFLVTAINYADRATISIAGTSLSKDLGLDAVTMGFIFSAFGWSYVIGQLPGGWLLDRFGSKPVYAASIFIWSVFTLLQGAVSYLSVASAIGMLFTLRFLVGLSEAPSFPANGRIVAAWFPAAERGTASAVFNSAQYFATVLFAPIMGWITHAFGWPYVFYFMGAVGIVVSVLWLKVIHSPREHPGISKAEFDYIEQGGALVDMDRPKKDKRVTEAELELDYVEQADVEPGVVKSADILASTGPAANAAPKLGYMKQLLSNRMLLGVYIGQYCITTITYFFLTWFPVYLVKERGMSILNAGFIAALPAICGFIGGVLGGLISDYLIRKGHSLTFARKTPIVVGMLMSTTMIACNYVSSSTLVVAIMAFAFFGKGLGALGWAVVADTSPKEIAGLSGGMFNTFGNVAAITTPIVIGYIVKATGNFSGALVFVACNALVAIVSYLVIVGEIKRVQLRNA
ncbi:D-glucarate permease [Caballeronia glathei]|jgi:ACS family glucarate transporter-like MFS transporter|uniref:MFS transporter n=1 Tax=Caballeronia glathei TaxID=60547 RepID=UPI0005064DEF|nr:MULTISPECIES: MFS transporter [Burkholderiaceae]TCK36671.1 ACS family glucarate transporter-like MFS transporter [Paraburkholderia sp. BL8N3]CDY77137.1 D-glucarate permease [Caballeronia glathei]